jgi:hypothetical protein
MKVPVRERERDGGAEQAAAAACCLLPAACCCFLCFWLRIYGDY